MDKTIQTVYPMLSLHDPGYNHCVTSLSTANLQVYILVCQLWNVSHVQYDESPPSLLLDCNKQGGILIQYISAELQWLLFLFLWKWWSIVDAKCIDTFIIITYGCHFHFHCLYLYLEMYELPKCNSSWVHTSKGIKTRPLINRDLTSVFLM